MGSLCLRLFRTSRRLAVGLEEGGDVPGYACTLFILRKRIRKGKPEPSFIALLVLVRVLYTWIRGLVALGGRVRHAYEIRGGVVTLWFL